LGQAIESSQGDSIPHDDVNTGLLYIWKEILKALQEQGVMPIQVTIGDTFDPTKHEAIGVIPSSDYPPNSIARILRTGWQHQDRIIRPTTVQTTVPA
jgi:molecular chaperone GrpE